MYAFVSFLFQFSCFLSLSLSPLTLGVRQPRGHTYLNKHVLMIKCYQYQYILSLNIVPFRDVMSDTHFLRTEGTATCELLSSVPVLELMEVISAIQHYTGYSTLEHMQQVQQLVKKGQQLQQMICLIQWTIKEPKVVCGSILDFRQMTMMWLLAHTNHCVNAASAEFVV